MNHITIVGLGFEGIQGLTLEAYEKLMQPEDAKIVLKTSKYKITQFLISKHLYTVFLYLKPIYGKYSRIEIF